MCNDYCVVLRRLSTFIILFPFTTKWSTLTINWLKSRSDGKNPITHKLTSSRIFHSKCFQLCQCVLVRKWNLFHQSFRYERLMTLYKYNTNIKGFLLINTIYHKDNDKPNWWTSISYFLWTVYFMIFTSQDNDGMKINTFVHICKWILYVMKTQKRLNKEPVFSWT